MNIGIDIDGTLTKFPQFFIELGTVWRLRGHKVFVITGLGHEAAIQKLQQYGGDLKWFDRLLDTSMYNQNEIDLIGKLSSNELVVGHFKQRMCRENSVQIMFDDMAQVHRTCGNIPIFEVK